MGPRPPRRGVALNHTKLDAALARAVEGRREADPRDLVVFVETESDEVRTATVSAREVDELSEQPSVRRLRLARGLHLTDGG